MIVTNIQTNNKLKSKRLLLIPVVLIVLGAVLFGVYALLNKEVPLAGIISPTKIFSNLQAKGAYWAVFLTNGQTYFGKLDPDDLNGNYVTLSEVHYLEKSSDAAAAPATKTAPQPAASGYNLVKLGNELHGPTDTMIINRQSVLFIEQLKSDSKVVAAIAAANR